MQIDFKEKILAVMPHFGPHWESFEPFIKYRVCPAKTVLLQQGDIARHIFIVLTGCIRAFALREDGSEVTIQFFLEGQMVASMESFFTGAPSRVALETLERTEAAVIAGDDFQRIMASMDFARSGLTEYLKARLVYYMRQHLSFILDSPAERYIRLLEEHPQIAERVPQHYIATYLGITPVSLSRIRSRLKKNGRLNKG